MRKDDKGPVHWRMRQRKTSQPKAEVWRRDWGKPAIVVAMISALFSAGQMLISQRQTQVMSYQSDADLAAKTRERLLVVASLLDKLNEVTPELLTFYSGGDCGSHCADLEFNVEPVTITQKGLPQQAQIALESMQQAFEPLALPRASDNRAARTDLNEALKLFEADFLRPIQSHCLVSAKSIHRMAELNRLVFALRLGFTSAKSGPPADFQYTLDRLREFAGRKAYRPSQAPEEDEPVPYRFNEFRQDVSLLTLRHMDLWQQMRMACEATKRSLDDRLRLLDPPAADPA